MTDQEKAFRKFSRLKCGALFMSMGTGKTKVALELAQYKYNQGKVDLILYIAPASALRSGNIEREGGCLPVSVIDKPLSDRMASTIRHNRARGSHDVDLMTNIVAELKEIGMSDAWILKHLGMDADELLRLKQLSGLASLFADKDFSKSWVLT